MQDADRNGPAPDWESGNQDTTERARTDRPAKSVWQDRWFTLPNIVSLLRIAIAPVVGWLIMIDQPVWAFWIFLVAGASDGLDGGLARWLGMRTELGSLLDPIGDKVLLAVTFLALGFQAQIPLWLVALVLVRDLGLVLAAGLIHVRPATSRGVSPTWVSKINTGAQIALAGAALAAMAFALPPAWVIGILIWVTAVTTAVSGFDYLIRLVRSSHTDGSMA